MSQNSTIAFAGVKPLPGFCLCSLSIQRTFHKIKSVLSWFQWSGTWLCLWSQWSSPLKVLKLWTSYPSGRADPCRATHLHTSSWLFIFLTHSSLSNPRGRKHCSQNWLTENYISSCSWHGITVLSGVTSQCSDAVPAGIGMVETCRAERVWLLRDTAYGAPCSIFSPDCIACGYCRLTSKTLMVFSVTYFCQELRVSG